MTAPLTPEDETAALLEAGRLLFARDCRFVTGAAHLAQVPDDALPEVAFGGRSNVGKSSLVNALTGRKTLAKASNTPGRTRQLNFFNLGGRLCLADLPGYGYARASKSEIRIWTELTRSYLKGRASLRRACLLIDSRHGIKDGDRDAMKLMDDAAVVYQVVLTKCDKIKAGALTHMEEKTAAEISTRVAAHPEIIATSARSGQGIPELRAALAALAASPEFG